MWANPVLNLAPLSRWTLGDKAAQRRLVLRLAKNTSATISRLAMISRGSMGKAIKVMAGFLIGAVTVWPLVHLSLFIYFFLSGDNIFPDKEIPYRVKLIMYLQPYMLLTLVTIIASFITYALLSKKIPKDKKTLWAALMVFGGIFVTPIFWYHYIWKMAWIGSDQANHLKQQRKEPKSQAKNRL